MPPNKVGPVHFTQSLGKLPSRSQGRAADKLDYMIVVKGHMQVGTTNGQVYDLKQGDITINLGNVHNFINPTDEWASKSAVFRIVPNADEKG